MQSLSNYWLCVFLVLSPFVFMDKVIKGFFFLLKSLFSLLNHCHISGVEARHEDYYNENYNYYESMLDANYVIVLIYVSMFITVILIIALLGSFGVLDCTCATA